MRECGDLLSRLLDAGVFVFGFSEPALSRPSAEQWGRQIVALQPALMAHAMVLCRNRDRAEDLVQDTLIKALAKPAMFQPGTNLKAWLSTILRNTFLTALRKKREEADPDGRLTARLCVGPSQEDRLASAQALGHVARLSPAQAESLMLIELHGLSYEEAAERCDCPVGTIKSRVSRGKVAARAALA